MDGDITIVADFSEVFVYICLRRTSRAHQMHASKDHIVRNRRKQQLLLQQLRANMSLWPRELTHTFNTGILIVSNWYSELCIRGFSVRVLRCFVTRQLSLRRASKSMRIGRTCIYRQAPQCGPRRRKRRARSPRCSGSLMVQRSRSTNATQYCKRAINITHV